MTRILKLISLASVYWTLITALPCQKYEKSLLGRAYSASSAHSVSEFLNGYNSGSYGVSDSKKECIRHIRNDMYCTCEHKLRLYKGTKSVHLGHHSKYHNSDFRNDHQVFVIRMFADRRSRLVVETFQAHRFILYPRQNVTFIRGLNRGSPR